MNVTLNALRDCAIEIRRPHQVFMVSVNLFDIQMKFRYSFN
jgi:hypothetical protein